MAAKACQARIEDQTPKAAIGSDIAVQNGSRFAEQKTF